MAHFAELDSNNTVTRVVVVDNKDILDAQGQESEIIGIQFLQNLLGGRWTQTSYNANFRKNYAGMGYTYDGIRDAFIPPKPAGEYYVLDENTCRWIYQPPIVVS